LFRWPSKTTSGKISVPKNLGLGILGATIALAMTILLPISDFYLPNEQRGFAQQAIWFLCSVGFLLIAVRGTLKRKQLLLPFGVTILAQCLLMYAFRSWFPLSNSLLLIIFWLPGIAILGITFAALARLLDPHGSRPS
jgi:hypothetical protein